MAYGYNATAPHDYQNYAAQPQQQHQQPAPGYAQGGYNQGWESTTGGYGNAYGQASAEDPAAANKKNLHYTIYAGKNGVDGGVYDLGNPYGDSTPPPQNPGYAYAPQHPVPPAPANHAQPTNQPLQPFSAQQPHPPQRSMTYDNPYGGQAPAPAPTPGAYSSPSPGAGGLSSPVPGGQAYHAPPPVNDPYGQPRPSFDIPQRPGTAPGYVSQGQIANGGPNGGGYDPYAYAVESDSQEIPNFQNMAQPQPSASPDHVASNYDTAASQANGGGLGVPQNSRRQIPSTYGEEHIEYYTRAHTGQDDPYYPGPPNGRRPPGPYGPGGRGPPPRGRGGPPGSRGPPRGPPPRGPDGRPLPDRSRGPPPPGGRGPPPGWDPRRGPPPNGRRPPPGAGPPGSRGPRGPPPPGSRDQRDPRDPRSKSRPPGPDGRRRDDRRPDDRRPPGARGPNGPAPGSMPPRPSTAPGRRPDESRSPRPSGPGDRPPPVRPGLQPPSRSDSQPSRPPPVRQYSSEAQPGPQAEKRVSLPVSQDDLSRLRGQAQSRPNDAETQMQLAKALVKASKTLVDDGGRADPPTREANKKRYQSEAAEIVKRAASTGDAEAMFFKADCMGTGALGIPNDAKEAFGLYQAAAKSNHPQAAYRTAVCCELGPQEGGGTVQDHQKAIQWYQRAANLGDTPAMFKLGMISLRGLLGQPKNIQDGAMWLQQAAAKADEQDPHAVHELAILYEHSENPGAVPKDETRALQLFTQGAKLGYRASQFRLGQAWEYGMLGCPVDSRNSIIWYTRAAAQGERNSELALSGWYLTGAEGILEHSDTEAYLWARKAGTNTPPLPKALFALGYYTEVGIGCPRSLEEAKKWYSKAAALGFPKAQKRLDELNRGGVNVQKTRERLSRSNQKQQEAECTIM